MAVGQFLLWQLANFCYGTWPIFVVALGIAFFPICREILIFQTPYRDDQNAISSAVGIIADTSENH